MQSGSVFPPFQPENIHTIEPAFNRPHAHLLKLTSDKFYLFMQNNWLMKLSLVF